MTVTFERFDNVAKMLKKVADIEDKETRREALRFLLTNQQQIAVIVQYAFHPDVVFDLPMPIPDNQWTPSKLPNHRGLIRSAKLLQHLRTTSNVSKLRKQRIFIDTLEVLEPEDVELLKAVMEKKLPWKTLNKSFVMAAIPELFPPAKEKEEVNK